MANITYGLRWTATLVAIPAGANPMEVPSAQVLKVSDTFAPAGGTPSGIIILASTGAYPTSGNVSTACTAMATAAAALFNANPQAAQWQQWPQGGG